MKKEKEGAVHPNVKLCFESNPDIQSYHVTDDGQCFTRDDDAQAHQASIKGKHTDVSLVRRDEVLDARALVNKNTNTAKTAGSGAEGAKAHDAEATKAFEEGKVTEVALTDMKFKELQSVCETEGFPEDEWKSFTAKKDLIEYLQSKEVKGE